MGSAGGHILCTGATGTDYKDDQEITVVGNARVAGE